MKRALAFLMVLLIAVPSIAHEAAQDFVGTWESPEIRATFEPDSRGPGALRGKITKGTQTFDCMATANGPQARGAFDAGGKQFEFSVMLQNGELSLTTGTSTYVLKRVGAPAPAPAQKRNPLEDDDRSAPNPGPAPSPMPGPSPAPNPGPAPSGAPGVIAVQLWTNDDGFIEVRAVMPDGPADKAGVKAGDIITAIDGKEIPPKTMATTITSTRGPVGSTVTLSILRDGRPQQITITRGPGMSAQAGGGGPGPQNPGPQNPGGQNPGGQNPGANATMYVHPQGMFHVQVPAGWTEKPGNDPNSTVWTHPKGGMVFITLIPQAPMPNGEALFKSAVGPGLQQSGAQILDGQNFPLPDGNNVFVADFRRQRNGVDELGRTACVVHQGTGMIMQMLMPDAVKEQLGPDLMHFGQSFDFGRPR